MGEIYYTIKVSGRIVAQNVRAEYVSVIINGMLTEWSADYSLEISIKAQDPNVKWEG